MKETIIVVLLAVVIALCSAQQEEIVPGACSNLLQYSTVKNFDASRYVGRWYEVKRINNFFQGDGECTTAHYSANDDGTVRVENSQINPDRSRYTEIGVAAVAFPDYDDLPAILNVTFPSQSGSRHPNYYVLDTDYESYSLVWNCVQFGPVNKAEYMWFLVRNEFNREIPASAQKILDTYFEGITLRETKQGAFCIDA